MLRNYFKVALRNIRKNPGYSLINIFGLALGMGVSMLILLYVQYEMSYDQYHENSDRIVRVSRSWFNEDGTVSLHLGHVAPPFGPLLEEDFEEVREAVRFFQVNPLITYEDHAFVENRFFFADPEVFEVFSWEMVEGDPSTALTNPDGVVLTRSAARKYFGEEEAMGRTLQFELQGQQFAFQVRGVMENVPDNSHFQFDMLASMEPVVQFYGGQEAMMQNYGSNNFATYLLLPEGYDPGRLQEQMSAFVDRHMGTGDDGVPASESTALNLWELTDIHLYSHLDSEIEANGNIEYIYIFTAIALFILIIACINFMNLSTARSSRRAVEVGLRKVVGADRQAIVRQFYGESVLLALFALAAAVAMVYAALPWFNDFLDLHLQLNLLQNGTHLAGLAGLVVFVGLVAGSYPALFLSSFQPADVLKGTFASSEGHARFRSTLVVTQFAISIALIICLSVVYSQLDFMRQKDLGFDRENIAVLPSSPQINSDVQRVRERLLSHSAIRNVAVSSRVPSGRLLDAQDTRAEVDGTLQDINFRIADIHVSHTFMETYGIELAAGRDFDPRVASDSTEAFILNEAAVEAIGWASPQQAVGKTFHYGGRRGRVTGVMQDFHFESLHQRIAPIVFIIPQNRINNVSVKIAEGRREEALDFLEEQWATLRAGFPFTHYFVEESFNEQYAAEERLGQIFTFFAGLAIVIAALGLLGLASFTAQQRIKEVGIRKVFGASPSQIVLLLSRRFTLLVLVSMVLAAPAAWYAMDYWLEQFAYRTPFSPWDFLLAGGLALIVAWGTISWQALRAATTNPAEALRLE